jgi:predicted dehydrogenase
MAAAEAKRPDRIDAVSIVTPNHVHFAPAKAFLEAGIHVICDKPLTTTVEDALALAEIVRRSRLIFGLTHNYTGYPLVRQAREMIKAGEVGRIRVVQVEYAQDWLTTAVEQTGQKQAVWRTDPAQSGPAGSLGDIGTHAYNLACFVTGLRCDQLAAEASIFVPGRRLDDNVQMLLRFDGGARGMLWASQVATGNENNLRLRVYGEKAGLEWGQENPNYLRFTPYGNPPVTISRAGAGATDSAKHASRIPSGHPEGYLERSHNLYGLGGTNRGTERGARSGAVVTARAERGGRRSRSSIHFWSPGIFTPKLGLGKTVVIQVGRLIASAENPTHYWPGSFSSSSLASLPTSVFSLKP